jgi:Protein of unknown function (DUF3168)
MVMTTLMRLTDALQQAVVARLRGNALFMSHVSGVYDDVPKGALLPYLTFGNLRVRDISPHQYASAEIQMELHLWSDYSGKKELIGLMQEVEALLKVDTLTLGEGTLISLSLVSQEVQVERGILMRQGRMRYVMIVQESSHSSFYF